MNTLKKALFATVIFGVALASTMAFGTKEEAITPSTNAVATPTVEKVTPVYTTIDKEEILSSFSYAYGSSLVKDMTSEGISFNSAYFFRGLYDACQGTKTPLVATSQTNSIIQQFVTSYYSKGTKVSLGTLQGKEEILKLSAPTTVIDKFSYIYAYQSMVQFLSQGLEIQPWAFIQGAAEMLYHTTPVSMTTAECEKAMQDYSAILQEKKAKIAAENLAAAEQFLTESKDAVGIKVINDYVLLQTLKTGDASSVSPTAKQTVIVDYTLNLLDGTQADAGKNVTFPLTSLIPGFVEGVTNMKVGEEARIYIHPDHGYGTQDLGTIGPNSLLIFTVKLIRIED